jgi:uncharacterized membrane protein
MRRPSASAVLRIALTPLIVWGLYVIRANVWFRLYPAIVVSLALTVFALSLFRTPIVEVFARRMGESLDARGVRYCRRVTVVWTAFLAAHLAVTIATVFASHEVWALYNGLIAYVLMGALFAGEWLCRRRLKRV